jgi:hypothetical protein
MNRPELDLMPGEYKSERKKPREPIFGPGLPSALAYLFGFAVVFTALQWLR